jgi:hypothetical protein
MKKSQKLKNSKNPEQKNLEKLNTELHIYVLNVKKSWKNTEISKFKK